jgi:hypothetical protein
LESVTFYDLQIRKEKQVTEKLLLFVILTNLLLSEDDSDNVYLLLREHCIL